MFRALRVPERLYRLLHIRVLNTRLLESLDKPLSLNASFVHLCILEKFNLMDFFFFGCRFKNVKEKNKKMGIVRNKGRVERLHQKLQSTTLHHSMNTNRHTKMANQRRSQILVLQPMELKRVLRFGATSVVHTCVRRSLWFHSTTMDSTSTLVPRPRRLPVPMAYSSRYFCR